jgi:hypothetical protein
MPIQKTKTVARNICYKPLPMEMKPMQQDTTCYLEAKRAKMMRSTEPTPNENSLHMDNIRTTERTRAPYRTRIINGPALLQTTETIQGRYIGC